MEFTPSTDLKSDILRLIEWRGDGLSFIEICQHLPDARGDLPIIFEPNLVVWVDVSDLLISALNELIVAGSIHYQTCSDFIYLVDGGGLRLPLAKSGRSYKKPHWFRVIVSKGPVRKAA